MHSRATRRLPLPDNDRYVGTASHIAVVQEIVCVKRRHRIILIIGSWEGWSGIAVVATAATAVIAAAISLEWRWRWFCIVSGTLEIVIDAFDVVVIAVVHSIRCLAIVLGPHLTIFVVIVAQNLIITQIESIANAKSAGEKRINSLFASRKILKNLVQLLGCPLTCDCTVDTQNIPNDRHSVWLASPFRMPESIYCTLHRGPYSHTA